MPIREFACPSCGRVAEELRPMNDDSSPACPGCGAPMERRLSVPAPHRHAHGGQAGGTRCCGRDGDAPSCGEEGACCHEGG